MDANIIAKKYVERMNELMSLSWRIFKSQFVNQRYHISKEAPFQHHFSDIIRQVGNLHCLSREDVFLVDLETRCDDVKGKNKYLDITCEFVNHIKCAIELKFKKDSQGAQDHGRIDIYTDIEALELVCANLYNLGKFYAITDSAPYINESKKGVGTIFPTHNGHITKLNNEIVSLSKGRENIVVNLKSSYTFNWEKIGKWYFLEITVKDLQNKAD
ncbi:hypothetical protein EON78_00735 [bacterium]|nr:MAG: hypothetical protein EON78_00735 [bacterium]